MILQGFKLDLNVIIPVIAGPAITALIFWATQRAKKREQSTLGLDRVSELTAEERARVDEQAAQLRREERAYLERVAATNASMADSARKRSHLLANGYQRVILAHQELLRIVETHQCKEGQAEIEIPEALYLRDVTANILVQLETLATKEQAETERSKVNGSI